MSFLHLSYRSQPSSTSINTAFHLVHGCPDPIDEVGTHSKRDGNILEVTCDRTGEVSLLTCAVEARVWVGERADCSEGKTYHIRLEHYFGMKP